MCPTSSSKSSCQKSQLSKVCSEASFWIFDPFGTSEATIVILQQVFSTPAKELANRWILVAIWISKTHPLFARLLCELRSVQVDNRENKLVKTMSKQDHALLTNTVKKKTKQTHLRTTSTTFQPIFRSFTVSFVKAVPSTVRPKRTGRPVERSSRDVPPLQGSGTRGSGGWDWPSPVPASRWQSLSHILSNCMNWMRTLFLL